MFKSLLREQTHQQDEKRQRAKLWRDLITRLALKDNLNPSDVITLKTIHSELGLGGTIGEWAADIAEHAELATAAEQVEKIGNEMGKADAAIVAFDDETLVIKKNYEATIAKRAAARGPLVLARVATTARHDQATAARQRRATIEGVRSIAFKDPEPAKTDDSAAAEVTQRAYILHDILQPEDYYKIPEGDDTPKRLLGCLMTQTDSIHDRRSLREDLAGLDFVRAPGQSAAEFESLSAIVHGIKSGRITYPDQIRFVRYRTPRTNYREIDLNKYRNFILFEDAISPNTSTGSFEICLYPGQSPGELRALLQEMSKNNKNFATHEATRSQEWERLQQGKYAGYQTASFRSR